MAEAAKSKLYVVIDEDEGILFINMDLTDPERKLTGATFTLADLGDGGSFNDAALRAIGFATEFDGPEDSDLREKVAAVYETVKFDPKSGIKFAFATTPIEDLMLVARRRGLFDVFEKVIKDVSAKPKR